MKREQYYKIMQTYQPSYWQNFLEMQEILKAGAEQLDSIQDLINTFINDGFILTASENKIASIEKFFAFDGSNKTLDERKKYILFRFRGFKKFNATLIKEICNFLINKDIEVSFIPSDIILDFAGFEILQYDVIKEFYEFLHTRKPAHLGILMIIKALTELKTCYGIISNTTQTRRNRFDFNKDILSNTKISHGISSAFKQQRSIKTNFDKDIEINSKHLYATTINSIQKRKINMDVDRKLEATSNLFYGINSSTKQQRVINTDFNKKINVNASCSYGGLVITTRYFTVSMQT